MTGHDAAERAWVQQRLASLADRFDQAAAEMAADLDLYRDDWSSRHAEQLQAHNERMRQMEADQAAWFKNWYDGDDESAPTDVGRGQVDASAAGSSPATPPGPGPGQPIHAAELAEAERIRSMSMAEYAARRAELGVRNPTDMNRLFGERQ